MRRWWTTNEENLRVRYKLPHEMGQCPVKALLGVHSSDSCSCECCPGGCTPLTFFLRSLVSREFWDIMPGTPMADTVQTMLVETHETITCHPIRGSMFAGPMGLRSIVWRLVQFIQGAQLNITMEQHLEIVRFLTHGALGIAHTCCRFSEIDICERTNLPTEEVEEINSEQTYLLQLLDDLVVEFEQVSREGRGGLLLGLCDPDEFWRHRWADRMCETLEGLNGNDIGKEERSKASDIGVVWDANPPLQTNWKSSLSTKHRNTS
ncbi:hypothetical protein SAMD00023353_9300320 [Rosellinia necatrix]|uniref:Uncharacterized protein n=1 Tax=Rosellinia necatrix TaxID=77044 RepID=A0A1S8AB27_ROSNE|nr:hypothetical protein SAMD00023353_9300320 [Rosellinia necatrix]